MMAGGLGGAAGVFRISDGVDDLKTEINRKYNLIQELSIGH